MLLTDLPKYVNCDKIYNYSKGNLRFNFIHTNSKSIKNFSIFAFDNKKNVKNIYLKEAIEKGSVAIKDDEIIEYPAKQNLTITDLTGAGDLFAAGYLNGYLNKMPINDCLKQGTELSSEVIQKIGARI